MSEYKVLSADRNAFTAFTTVVQHTHTHTLTFLSCVEFHDPVQGRGRYLSSVLVLYVGEMNESLMS